MRFKLLTLALIAGVLIAAVPAVAQDDTSSYTSTTPTVTTPTTDTTAVDPAVNSGGEESSGALAQTGSDTWVLLAIGGALAIGSALLLARERRPRRNR